MGVLRTMRLISLFLLVAVVASVAALSHHASAQQRAAVCSGSRFALVIGNANYPDAEAPLKEPVNDARALADELRGDGFEVEVVENLKKDAMRQAFDRFYRKLTKGSAALLFFSGYGIQSNSKTFMIPVDAQIWSEENVRQDGIGYDQVLAEMNKGGASVKIVILDASRRNPFEPRFRNKGSAGLGPIFAPSGTLVMYSAAPGSLVNESKSGRSLFVTELLKALSEPNLRAEEVANRTSMGVNRGTQADQVPSFSSSLSEAFSFKCSKVPNPAPQPQVETTPQPAPPPSLNAACVHRSPHDLDEIKTLESTLRRNPDDVQALYRRGKLYVQVWQFQDALEDFDHVLRLESHNVGALNNRCWVRAITGNLQAALKDCNDALQIRAQFAEAFDSRGFVNLKIGLPKQAALDFEKALQSAPRQASSLYGRGIAKLRIGDDAGSKSDIDSALTIDPTIGEEIRCYGLLK
jgi:hypothetical protein